MADNHIVRVAGGWLKWDKEHHKWENVEESAASKNHVLKRAKSCVAVPSTREPSPFLNKRPKPLEPPRNKVIAKKPPVVKNKTPKRHSVICLSSHVSSNVRVTADSHPVVSQRAAPSSGHHDRSCDTNADPTTSGHMTGVADQMEYCESAETPSSSNQPTNRSVLPMEERMSQDHSAMITILSGRRMRLQAAATLWRQCGGGALVSYLLKVNDESVTADILPILVISLHSKKKSWNELTVETCFELQPLINQLLHSKYEDHIVKVLSFLDAVLNFWDNKQQNGHQLTSSCLLEFVNDISESVRCLFQQNNAIYNKAKRLDSYMKQLILKHHRRT